MKLRQSFTLLLCSIVFQALGQTIEQPTGAAHHLGSGKKLIAVHQRHLMERRPLLLHHAHSKDNVNIAAKQNETVPDQLYFPGALRYHLLKQNPSNFTFAEIKLDYKKNQMAQKVVGFVLESVLMYNTETYKKFGFIPVIPAPYFIYK